MQELFSASGAAGFMAEHPAQWVVTAGVVGACMASFVGVVAGRLPHSAGWRPNPAPGVDLMQPSTCDSCGTRLSALALTPVFGWLALRGRCRSCGSAVPAVYPAVETVTAAASAGLALLFGPTEAALWAMALLWTCLAVSWIDLREGWIPERLTAPMTILGLIASPFEPDALSRSVGMSLCFAAMAASGALVSWRRDGKVSIGGGDLALAAAAGAWLGQPLAPAFLLLSAVLQLATHAASRRLPGGRWEPQDPDIRALIGDFDYAPMGPAICVAFFICLVMGSRLAVG